MGEEKTETSGDGDEAGYDAVVVGSGYGGSVASCRMSMAGINVCLIEKGRRWEANDFPTNSFNLFSALRMENEKRGFSFGRKDALLQVYEQDDSVAVVACGLGGGSLVNAGVVVSTPTRARKNKKWPKEWDSDWEVCEASASTMLRAQSVPVTFPSANVMKEMLEGNIEEFKPDSIKLSINFDSKHSIGSQQTDTCLACGNCLSGCPYNAKNSTDKNYLASAVQDGCTIKTECQVQYVVRNLDEGCQHGEQTKKKSKRRWRVYMNDIDYILCDFVIISGSGFSSNGNTCAYLSGSSAPLSSYGLNKSQFPNISFQDRPGPSISSSFTSSLGFTIQSAVLPTSYPYFPFKGILTYGWPNRFWFLHGVLQKLNHMLGLKASQDTALNVMGYDDSDGKISLDNNTNRICFSPPRDPLLLKKVEALQKLTKKLGGVLFMSRSRSTSVHLLGGCNAASDPSQGICDPNGRVFDSEHPPMVHPGLYVCDASLIPCAIGINPCLTVATAAEHVSRYLVQDVLRYRNSTSLDQLPVQKQTVDSISEMIVSKSTEIDQTPITVIQETMRGYIGGMPCTAHLTLKMKSVDCRVPPTIQEPQLVLRGKVGGYVIFEAAEKGKLYIIEGKVDMCKVDNRTPYTQYMHYHLVLASSSGSRYILEGNKTMSPYLLCSYAWKESTTLHVAFTTVEQRTKEPKIPLKGELSVSLVELFRSLISLKGNAKGRFVWLLLKSLFQTYIVQTPRGSCQDFTPIDSKEMPYPPSTRHEIKTEDGVFISCQQWKCKQDEQENEQEMNNPVLLINGYATESYWLPTEPNDFVRTLLQNQHETWMLQPRLHHSHPLNKFTVEDIGKFDIPAVIKKMGELHGSSVKVHVVAHCVGGLAIHIAIMGGHISSKQIASLSCTNSSMFFQLTTSSLVKMTLPLIPISMGILGKQRILSMFRNSKTSQAHRLLKSIARMLPRCQRCTYDECEVFSGIFGNAFWHENVSPSTHHWLNTISLPKLPMSGFPHLRKICTAGFIVDPDGRNKYMIYPERMAVDTLYISGGRPLRVTPRTSFLAHQYMKLHQPDYRHTRVVVDGFGHSDLWIGEESFKKVFPHIISHIKQGRNRDGDTKESEFKKKALLWSWDDDPCEASICGLLGCIGIFKVIFVLLLLFLLIITFLL